MKIIIDIADDLQEFNAEVDSIIVGAGPDCDIVLEYESIGAKHLSITIEDSQVFVTDLSSGYPTFLNNEQVPAGSKFIFEHGAPVEIGGIYLHNQTPMVESAQFEEDPVDQVLEEKSDVEEDTNLDDLSKSLFSEDADEEVDDKKEKYKPNLFDDSLFTEESSSEQPSSLDEGPLEDAPESDLAKTIRQSSKTNSSINITNVKQKRRTKRANQEASTKKTKRTKPSSSSSIKFPLLIIALLGVMGYVYWFKIHIPNQERIAELREKQKYSVEVLNGNINKELKSFLDHYFQNKPCDSEDVSKPCSDLKSYFNSNSVFDGANKYSSSLIIAFNFDFISETLNSAISKDVNDEFLENLVNSDFSKKFDYEYFLKANKKAPYKSYEYERNDSRDLIFFAWLIMNKNFESYKNFQDIIFVSYTKGATNVQVINTLRVVPENILIKKTLAEYNDNKLKAMWNHNLIKAPKKYFSSFGDLFDKSFDASELQKEIGLKRNEGYLKNLSAKKCNTDFTLRICKIIKQTRGFTPSEGALLLKNRLLLYFNLEKISEKFSELYSKNYTNDEKRELIRYFEAQNNGSQTVRDFQLNDYVMNYDEKIYYTNVVLSDFIDSAYFDDILKSNTIESIAFIGIKQSTLVEGEPPVALFAMEFSKDRLKYFDKVKAVTEFKYFWESKINIFSDITSGLENFTVFEEKK